MAPEILVNKNIAAFAVQSQKAVWQILIFGFARQNAVSLHSNYFTFEITVDNFKISWLIGEKGKIKENIKAKQSKAKQSKPNQTKPNHTTPHKTYTQFTGPSLGQRRKPTKHSKFTQI